MTNTGLDEICNLGVQGYLAHKKTPSPPGMGLLQEPRGLRFLISEVPLWGVRVQVPGFGLRFLSSHITTAAISSRRLFVINARAQ